MHNSILLTRRFFLESESESGCLTKISANVFHEPQTRRLLLFTFGPAASSSRMLRLAANNSWRASSSKAQPCCREAQTPPRCRQMFPLSPFIPPHSAPATTVADTTCCLLLVDFHRLEAAGASGESVTDTGFVLLLTLSERNVDSLQLATNHDNLHVAIPEILVPMGYGVSSNKRHLNAAS